MSSFIVENETINRVLAHIDNQINGSMRGSTRRMREAILACGVNLDTPDGIAELGSAMMRLNASAVEQRYSRPANGQEYRFTPMIPPTDEQAYKSLQCWLYQCSEGSVPESPLFKAMSDVLNTMAHNLVRSIPAYDKAVWG